MSCTPSLNTRSSTARTVSQQVAAGRVGVSCSMDQLKEVLADLKRGQDALMTKLTEDREENKVLISDMGKKLERRIVESIEPVTKRQDETDARLLALSQTVALLSVTSATVTRAPPETPAQQEPGAVSWASVANTPPMRQSPSPTAEEGNEARQRRLHRERTSQARVGMNADVRKAMEKAGRTLSFFPISNREVEKIEREMEDSRVQGAETNFYTTALRCALGEYLTAEMKLTTEEWDNLDLVEVFTPKGAVYNTVYAEFKTRREADMIKSNCVYLREGENLRVGRHIPWQARDRHACLETRAKALREEGFRTRIEQRDLDYVLLVRERSNPGAQWHPHSDQGDLPPFQSGPGGGDRLQKTPSKGRGRKLRTTPPARLPQPLRHPAAPRVPTTAASKHGRSPQADETNKKSRGGDTVRISSTAVHEPEDEEEEEEELVSESVEFGQEASPPVADRRRSIVSVNSLTFQDPDMTSSRTRSKQKLGTSSLAL